MFIFAVWLEAHFSGKFGPKNQKCQFKLKFGTLINLNIQNSVVMFTFSVLGWVGLIWSENSKLLVLAGIWFLD